MHYTSADHTFAICAYKDSPYLEECIKSVKGSHGRNNVIMVTSTPSEFISNLAEQYNVRLFINEGQGGIAQDWNFAIEKANTKLVTIAHQDDVYLEDYVEKMLEVANRSKRLLIAFSDYGEIRDGAKVRNNKLLNIKRIMLIPLRLRGLQRNVFIRRRILSMGSPICCPSVMFCKENLTMPIFKVQYKGNVDWQAWEIISKQKGTFGYVTDLLVYHRIHKDSETSALIANNDRTKEDYEMFSLFWGKKFAGCIMKFYAMSQKSNG